MKLQEHLQTLSPEAGAWEGYFDVGKDISFSLQCRILVRMRGSEFRC